MVRFFVFLLVVGSFLVVRFMPSTNWFWAVDAAWIVAVGLCAALLPGMAPHKDDAS